MSEILSNIVVENNNINFTPNNNNINFTPDDIQLNIYTTSAPGAGTSNNGELLYNNVNIIGGVANSSYANGNLTLGNVANVKITGGNNTYFLQTDGTGNLTWAVGTGNITGNGTPGGANTQIQFNDGGANFGGSAGFTFDKSSNIVNMPGNLTVAGNLSATGNGIFGNINGGNLTTANYFTGTLTTGNQSNITAVGNLVSLNVIGNLLTTGTTTIQQAKEKVTIDANAATGTINFDVLTQAILYKSANAIANFTINIRGDGSTSLNSVMSNNQSLTIALLNTNGITPYYANNFQIDGSNVTVKYVLNGTPTSGTSTGIDQYIYNIIKTSSNVYTVLGSKIGFL